MKEADVRSHYQLLHHSKETEIRIVDARLWREMARVKSTDQLFLWNSLSQQYNFPRSFAYEIVLIEMFLYSSY